MRAMQVPLARWHAPRVETSLESSKKDSLCALVLLVLIFRDTSNGLPLTSPTTRTSAIGEVRPFPLPSALVRE